MLFDENFRISSSPDFFAAFFRSPLFSRFDLLLEFPFGLTGFLDLSLGSYRSSRVLKRARFSKVSSRSFEVFDVPESDGSRLCLFGGRRDELACCLVVDTLVANA